MGTRPLYIIRHVIGGTCNAGSLDNIFYIINSFENFYIRIFMHR